MRIIPNGAGGNHSAWRDFLSALYAGAPQDLVFELRCIHPATGDARSFWSTIGDKRSLTRAFNRGMALNREAGHGLYFAPCLRDARSGRAEAAALLHGLFSALGGDPQVVHSVASSRACREASTPSPNPPRATRRHAS